MSHPASIKQTQASALPASSIDAFLASASGRRCSAMQGEGPAQNLLRSVYLACATNIPRLSRTSKHPSRDLCGAEYWAPLSRGLKSCAGMCVAFLVDRQDLPLQLHVTRSRKGSKTYWLKGARRPSTAPARTLPSAAYRGSVPGVR